MHDRAGQGSSDGFELSHAFNARQISEEDPETELSFFSFISNSAHFVSG